MFGSLGWLNWAVMQLGGDSEEEGEVEGEEEAMQAALSPAIGLQHLFAAAATEDATQRNLPAEEENGLAEGDSDGE
jgi:hypothetical protein